MPSYRYTKDIKPDDLKPDEAPEYTKKQKAGNWWRYHWGWVAGAAALVGLAVFFILDVTRTVDPDLTVGVVTPYALPQQMVDGLQDELAELVGDLNGDGQAVVLLDVYTVTLYDEAAESAATSVPPDDSSLLMNTEDPYAQMAGMVRMSTALSNGDPMLYIVRNEDLALLQEQYSLFGTLEGEDAPAGADPLELTLGFDELPLLGEWPLPYDAQNGVAEGRDLLQDYRLGLLPKSAGKNGDTSIWEAAHSLLMLLAGRSAA